MFQPAIGPERVLWIILIALVACYLLGSFVNRRLGQGIGRWLQVGLGKLGGRPAWQIKHSAGASARVTISGAAAPFRDVEITYALLTRELPPLWGYEVLTGRSDTLAIRAVLNGQPAGEIEVLPLNGPLRRKLDQAAAGAQWSWQAGPAGLGLATRGMPDSRLVAAVLRFLQGYGPHVQRLSLRARRPHLVVFLRIDRLRGAPAAGLFQALRDLGKMA
jgi:hypothetical protein